MKIVEVSVDELVRKLGIQVPEKKVVAVLDVREDLKMAVVECEDGERYLCTRVGCLDTGWSVVIFALWKIIGRIEVGRRLSLEEVEKIVFEKMMMRAFGGGDEK